MCMFHILVSSFLDDCLDSFVITVSVFKSETPRLVSIYYISKDVVKRLGCYKNCNPKNVFVVMGPN